MLCLIFRFIDAFGFTCDFSFVLANEVKKQPPELFYVKRCFLVNFVKFLRTPFLQNTSGRLLLEVYDEGGTILDNEIVNREIVNRVNNKNDDIDNVPSLNIVNDYCVNNFYDSCQLDACNSNNTGYETNGDNYDSQEDEWLQKQYKQWVSLSVYFFTLKLIFSQISWLMLSIIFI